MSNNKAELLKKSLMNFYKSKDNIDKITNVIEKETDYSLRVIEWFCNNYSKNMTLYINLMMEQYLMYIFHTKHNLIRIKKNNLILLKESIKALKYLLLNTIKILVQKLLFVSLISLDGVFKIKCQNMQKKT